MAKTSSVFVVVSGDYDRSVEAAFTSLDAAKDFLLSNILLDVLDGDEYLRVSDFAIDEFQGDDCVNTFSVTCQGFDFSLDKVTNRNKMLETLDLNDGSQAFANKLQEEIKRAAETRR